MITNSNFKYFVVGWVIFVLSMFAVLIHNVFGKQQDTALRMERGEKKVYKHFHPTEKYTVEIQENKYLAVYDEYGELLGYSLKAVSEWRW